MSFLITLNDCAAYMGFERAADDDGDMISLTLTSD